MANRATHEIDKDSNYSTTSLHYDMINDKYRTLTYCKSIENNSNSFKDKIVLDVGSGTGILSLFAARSGAKKVYAVECTSIGYISEKIIKDNHFEDVITVIHGRLEDIEIPEKVDIIISEWMGYALYFEVMLPSVIMARDKYLNDGGALLPSNAKLYISGIEDLEYYLTTIDFWNDVYGFNFGEMKEKALTEPVVDGVEKWQILTNNVTISDINIHTCDANACFFTSPFALTVSKDGELSAFALWFDVFFDDFQNKYTLSTSPFKKSTHWKQTTLFLKHPIKISRNNVIEGTITFAPHPEDSGGLSLTLEYKVGNGEKFNQQYDFS